MKVELSGHYGYWRLFKTMTPMVLMMIIISVYSIVDGLFISNYAGSDAFAGMNLIWPALAIVGALGLMVGSGGSALVSKTFGEGDPDKANAIFSMLMQVLVLGGVVLAAVIFVLMPWIVSLLGADEAMMPHAIRYGRILTIVLPAYMLQMAFQPFFMVAERPQFGTVMTLASGVTNIVMDALFVAGLGWGITGAALGTAMSLIVGGCVPLWFFASRRNRTQLKVVKTSLEWDSIAKSCTNGMSEFVGNIALNVIGICYNWQLMKYIGSDGVSAYGIIMYVGFIFAAVFIGYNMGVSQIISYNYGAGNRGELRSLLHKSLVIVSLSGALMTLVAVFCSAYIARMFVGYDPELCELTSHATRIYMLNFLVCGFNMFASAWFTALNNGVVSAVASFVRTLVFEMAAVFVLPLLFGLEGIWLSVNVAEVLALVLSATLVLSFRKRYGY